MQSKHWKGEIHVDVVLYFEANMFDDVTLEAVDEAVIVRATQAVRERIGAVGDGYEHWGDGPFAVDNGLTSTGGEIEFTVGIPDCTQSFLWVPELDKEGELWRIEIGDDEGWVALPWLYDSYADAEAELARQTQQGHVTLPRRIAKAG
jgi:hypothetical protein